MTSNRGIEMIHSLNNRLTKLEARHQINNQYEHLTDDELLAELKALKLRNDERFAGNSSDDPEIIRLETELAELYGVTHDEWRAMRVKRFLKKQGSSNGIS